MTNRTPSAFNSALEAGARAVCILFAAYPNAYDLQRLVAFDYLVVHTGDIGGPKSLHPRLPLRAAELIVRRKLVEEGLLLMISRGLVERSADSTGIAYRAGDEAETFVATVTVPYLTALRQRAEWVVRTFGDLDDEALRLTTSHLFGMWIENFQAAHRGMEVQP